MADLVAIKSGITSPFRRTIHLEDNPHVAAASAPELEKAFAAHPH